MFFMSEQKKSVVKCGAGDLLVSEGWVCFLTLVVVL
jgi:hypothetical protein